MRSDRGPGKTLAVALALVVAAALVGGACGKGDDVSLRRTIGGDGPGELAAATESGPGVPPPSIPAEQGDTPRESDRGVTDDRITIGVITNLTGPEAFVGEQPYLLAQAYADDVNERGGINGRELVVKGYDVCMACPEDGLAQAKKAVEEDGVFAILNGYIVSAALGPAFDYLADTGTPMVQTAAGTGISEYQFQFGLDRPYRGAIDADFVAGYLEDQGLPKKVALLRFAQPLDELTSAAQRRGLEAHGIEIVADEAVEYGGAEMVSQSSQVAKMRSAGASMVVGSHGVVCAFNMQAAAQVSWDVPYFCSLLYGDFALDLAGQAAEGRDVFTDSDGFAPIDDPSPGVERYDGLLATRYPEGEIGVVTMSAFLGMYAFEEAVESMGDDVTREGLIAHLSTLTDYDAGGLTPPFTVTPQDHVALRGAYLLELQDGEWVPISDDWVYPDDLHGLDG